MLWKLACVLDVDVGYFFAGLPREADSDPAARPADPPLRFEHAA